MRPTIACPTCGTLLEAHWQLFEHGVECAHRRAPLSAAAVRPELERYRQLMREIALWTGARVTVRHGRKE